MDITPRARHFIGVTLAAVAAFLVVAFVSVSPFDWPFHSGGTLGSVRNLSGPLGSALAWSTYALLGRVFAWLIPFILIALSVCTFTGGFASLRRWAWKASASVVLLNAFFALTPLTRDVTALRGGIGDTLAAGLSAVFGEIGGTIIVVASFLLVVLGELGRLFNAISGVPARLGAGSKMLGSLRMIAARRVERVRAYIDELRRQDDMGIDAPEIGEQPPQPAAMASEWKEPAEMARRPIEITGPPRKPAHAPRSEPARKSKAVTASVDDADKIPLSEASLPPLSILDRNHEKQATFSHEELRNWSKVLEEKLINYGVEGKVTAVHHGPVVTTFEFEPAPGVRIKEIVNRSDDLALAMRARSLRMIAPIPGRDVVGIEIPNPKSRIVFLHDVLDEVTEKQRLAGVILALGVDVVGRPFLMNLCEAPHLLIAGTTGSGKSVCINAIIASVLLQYRPSDVKLLLVDPKIVEMSMYNGIPHLLHPVITDPKEAARVLEYLVAEMHRRNELFRKHGVRNIESFNTKIAMEPVAPDEEPPEHLPYIVVIVDELGDLALAKGVDIETLLARLAQMARAAGIHMILATQRPSVDVIVGKTKANFPTRIAFRVATRVDSRTIIDSIGADKLLGKGDMLYMDAVNPQALRLHGAWVSEREVEDLIAHWKSFRFDDDELELDAGRAGGASLDDVDPLYEDAMGVVFQYKQGSTSLLQRKLHIGYARAARVLDQLEQNGVVGPPDGSKPREVYMDALDASGEE